MDSDRVVRAHDAGVGVAVSVLDGDRHYTLLPTNTTAVAGVPATYVRAGRVPVHSVGTEPCQETKHLLSHGAQVVDGRYASVYQMSHCNVHPTSPPVELTEFPPQRAELSRGKGNFEVGGIGSGETYGSPTRPAHCYRGGMNWPDRSVYSPRQTTYHYEPDPFADSLRKYPNMSPERSAEILERLINYTQKNSFSKPQRSSVSPTRSEMSPFMDRRSYAAAAPLRTARAYEPDVNVRLKVPDESPTRDFCKTMEYDNLPLKRSLFSRNYDVRYMRDTTRRAKETVRNLSTYPYYHPVCPPIKERYDHLLPKNNLIAELVSINSVHMETQAEIPMVSKEVTTLPREKPLMRNVAVPLLPISSQSTSAKLSSIHISNSAGQISHTKLQPETKLSTKSIQTIVLTDLSLKPRKSVQTCISSINITSNKKLKTCRKTKSQEEIRTNEDLEDQLLQTIQNLSAHSDLDANLRLKNSLLRKLRRMYVTDGNDGIKIKLGRCVTDQLCSHKDCKRFTRELSNELMSKIRASNMFLRRHGGMKVLKSDISSRDNEELVTDLIQEWLDCIPVKTIDYLRRPIKREHVLHAIGEKIKCLIMRKIQHDRCGSLKPEIIGILEDIPININSCDKNDFMNRIASDLVRKIKATFTINATDRKRWQKAIDLDKTLRNSLRKESFAYTYIQPTDHELKQFVKQELNDFSLKFNVKICPNTEKEIQIELIDILIDSLNTLRYGEDEKIKEEILIMLTDYINISENEGIYFVNNLIYNFKDMLKEIHTNDVLPQTFVVLQNNVQNSSNQTVDRANEQIEMQFNHSNFNSYTEKIEKQISIWMENIEELREVDKEIQKVVAKDIAVDIVDRHKYLQSNPSHKSSDADEFELLKYLIFKNINKLVGENSIDTIEHASQLMQRIQNIPVPALKRSTVTVLNIDTSIAACCKADSNPEQSEETEACGSKPKPKMAYKEKRRSCPYAFSYDHIRKEQNKSCAAEVDTKNLGVMTDSDQAQLIRENSCHLPPPPVIKTTYTETDMPQIPVTCPRGTSMGMIECPGSENTKNRRFSGPPGPISQTNMNIRRAEQGSVATPRCNIEQQNISGPRNADSPRPQCGIVEPTDLIQARNELFQDYDQYLQTWVSQIPIITSNPAEQELIEKMKKGIYNGVWKAWAKLQLNEYAMSNRYHLQDLFDDDLEELLNLLPQSPELTRNKQMLKNQLIEKTVNMAEQFILFSSYPPSFKQLLIDNLNKRMPREEIGFTSDIYKICEEYHKLEIAEMFILYTMYNEIDRVKAGVYKKKLTKRAQEFLDNLKLAGEFQGSKGPNINIKARLGDILNALYTVPLPSDETIREEADEVLIGFEIAQWFSDLPLYEEKERAPLEKLLRKQYRNSLAKKIHDIVKFKTFAECEEEIRHEISRFMGKLPIVQNELENVPFMVEELINRLKNRPNDLVVGSHNRRLIPLIEPDDYNEFSRHMQLCSSFSDAPDARRAQVNESSYMVDGEGKRIERPCCPLGGQFDGANYQQNSPDSNIQYFSFPENTIPNQQLPKNTQPIRQTCQQEEFSQLQRTTLPENTESPQANQTCQGLDPSIQWKSLYESPMNESLKRAMESEPYQESQQLPRYTSPRQTCQQPEPNQQSPNLRDEAIPQTSQNVQGIQLSSQNSSDCCQFQQPTAQRTKELEDRIQASMRSDPRLNMSRPQDTNLPGTCAGRPPSAKRRSSGVPHSVSYAPIPQEANVSGTCAGQDISQKSMRQVQDQNHNTPKRQETQYSGTCIGQNAVPDQRSPGTAGNAQCSGVSGNVPPSLVPANTSHVCPRMQESVGGSMVNNPDRSQIPPCGPEVSNRPYDAPAGPSQQQFSSRQSPSSFPKQPVFSSTPEQNGAPPRESRSKRRTRHVDKSRKDAARKVCSDSDDASEEVRCHCMERIYRSRKRRPSFFPCDECDFEFPPCFPMRFPYPYYF